MDLCTALDDSNVTEGKAGAADPAVTVVVDDLAAIIASAYRASCS